MIVQVGHLLIFSLPLGDAVQIEIEADSLENIAQIFKKFAFVNGGDIVAVLLRGPGVLGQLPVLIVCIDPGLPIRSCHAPVLLHVALQLRLHHLQHFPGVIFVFPVELFKKIEPVDGAALDPGTPVIGVVHIFRASVLVGHGKSAHLGQGQIDSANADIGHLDGGTGEVDGQIQDCFHTADGGLGAGQSIVVGVIGKLCAGRG